MFFTLAKVQSTMYKMNQVGGSFNTLGHDLCYLSILRLSIKQAYRTLGYSLNVYHPIDNGI